jgi:arabinose-5-phosphate isomerase
MSSNKSIDQSPEQSWVRSAQRTLDVELAGLGELRAAMDRGLGAAVGQAVAAMRAAKGRVIICGMGKSGHVGRKIAATLASTGTPSSFVHPAEASHGDLGMITADDCVLLLSNSGESHELKDVIGYCARFSIPMIAMTAAAKSTLGRAADVVLLLPKAQEACPNGQAPTTSTLLQLALGDALAVALLEDKGFTSDHFRNFHPGGKLGAQIKHASDIMHRGDRLPLVRHDARVSDAIAEINAKRFGCVGVVNGSGVLIGLVTDGDLRRAFAPDLQMRSVDAIMTPNPKTIHGDMLAGEVIAFINEKQITAIFVVDGQGKPQGLIHIHDLLRMGAA